MVRAVPDWLRKTLDFKAWAPKSSRIWRLQEFEVPTGAGARHVAERRPRFMPKGLAACWQRRNVERSHTRAHALTRAAEDEAARQTPADMSIDDLQVGLQPRPQRRPTAAPSLATTWPAAHADAPAPRTRTTRPRARPQARANQQAKDAGPSTTAPALASRGAEGAAQASRAQEAGLDGPTKSFAEADDGELAQVRGGRVRHWF